MCIYIYIYLFISAISYSTETDCTPNLPTKIIPTKIA